MLKMNKLTRVALIFSLCLCASVFWGTATLADQQGEVAIHDQHDQYQVSHRVIHQPYLDIDLWVDRGEGAAYYPGEEIKVYFRASRDCYVVIYGINTRGYVYLLYPYDKYDDYYVEGGRTYRIPDRFDDYDLTVDGPEGTEYIQAVASFDPVSVPNFPGLFDYYEDEEIYAYSLDGEDPFEFMEAVNEEIVSYDYASDVCMFNVEYEHPGWYYQPREIYVNRPVDVVWGGVYIDDPWGVEVWIDGFFYGITPITIPALVVGRHWFSFWYHGCWIWRDWFWIRRDRTIRLWADCGHRHRYVRDRFVEKSYRTEKAKRRRGIGERGGFVKPFDFSKKKRLAFAEKSSVSETHKYKKELRARKKTEAVRYKDPKAQLQQRKQKVKVTQDRFQAKEKRKTVKSRKEKYQIKEKRKIKKKDAASRVKRQSSKVKSVPKKETKRSQPAIKKSTKPKAQTKSTISRPAGKSTTSRPAGKTAKVQPGQKKRR
jgi:hypothetical protein